MLDSFEVACGSIPGRNHVGRPQAMAGSRKGVYPRGAQEASAGPNSVPCNVLRHGPTSCHKSLSDKVFTPSGEDRIRTCGGLSPSRV